MVQTSSSSWTDQTRDLRERIDAQLAAHTRFSHDCPDRLAEAIRYSLLAPGKRLRPTLVLLAAEACGGDPEVALPAACAVEMIHAYSLIHDDLPAMDDDDLRRGRPTCHTAFGEATAILAGDALLTLAFEVLARDTLPPGRAANCCACLARAAGPTGMVGGQSDDLEFQTSAGELTDLEHIHRRKTGAMFLASLQMGAIVAGASAEQEQALETYGINLGLAFQITDDLLDVHGDQQLLGKRVGKDSDLGKLTFPGLLGTEESTRRAERLVDEASAALEIFGPAASRLDALARYVLERNH